jgi:16S rRNA (adenine1518-N6/adenine1519-N6)-dimethyltransferase
MASVAEIKATLTDLGIHPSKALGQNFLLDERTIEFIVQSSKVKAGENVLEIGPGLGVLTEALARAGANVLAVEKDRTLARYLTEKFHNWRNVKIINQDALFFQPIGLGTYKLIANLPYNITSPILRKFLENDPKPSLIVVMVQKEVGERIVAPAGDHERGVLSVMVQFHGKPEIIGHVARSKFWPQPDVESVILRIDVVNGHQLTAHSKAFFTVVKAGFSKKRAQIHNALKNTLHLSAADVTLMLNQGKIDPAKRAEELTVEEWVELARVFEASQSK